LSHDLRRQPPTATLRTHPPAPLPGADRTNTALNNGQQTTSRNYMHWIRYQILAEGSDSYVQPPMTNTLTSSSQPVG
jgi:hypothetical protein